MIHNDPLYAETRVYGNVLIESDGEGNSQVIHYGGDSGATETYRKGTLYLHHNTVYSTRSGNTTLARLSTADETADVRNNIVHVTASGNKLAMLNGEGVMQLSHNWLKAGWVDSHSGGGVVIDGEGQLTGADPGFSDASGQDFVPLPDSPVVDQSGPDAPAPESAYRPHQRQQTRVVLGATLDRGAFESRPTMDLTDDGVVDSADLALLLGQWGDCPFPPAFCPDVDGDGVIGPADLVDLLAQWG